MKTFLLLCALVISTSLIAQTSAENINFKINITVNFSAVRGHHITLYLVDIDHTSDTIVITNTVTIKKLTIRNSMYQVILEFNPAYYDSNDYGICWKYSGMLVSATAPTKIALYPTAFQRNDTLLFYKK